MSTEMIPFALREDELELIVSEKTLGSLTTNAQQIKELVERALPNYDAANYDENNIADAKKDKAMLNNASKALNARRLDFEKEFMKPFAEFKAVVGETVDLIKTASSKIDAVVKAQEQREKDTKRAEVEMLWAQSGSRLVPLDKVFRATWLNKTTSIKSINSEIVEIVAKIESDITTIEAIGEDIDLLKGLYLDTLDLNRTIQHARTLKDNRERAKADAERKAALAAHAEEDASVAPQERIPSHPYTCPPPPPKPTSPPSTTLTRAFRVTGTRDDIIALGDFMNARGLRFEKIEING